MAYQINEVLSSDDSAKVLRLWEESFGASSQARFDWLYCDPESLGGRCWLASDDLGEIVASVGILFRRMRIGDEIVMCGQAVDLVVSPKHRSGGVALKLLRNLLEEARSSGCRLVYTYPLPRAIAIVRRVGFKELGTLTRWTCLLRSYEKLSSRLNPTAALCLAPLIDLSLRLRRRIRASRVSRNRRYFSMQGFGAEINSVWYGQLSFAAVVGERTAQFLAWRFDRYPGTGYRCFGIADADEPLGYVVFRATQGGYTIADLMYRDRIAAKQLLGHILNDASASGRNSVSIQCLVPTQAQETLASLGFAKRPEDARVLVYDLANDANQTDRNGNLENLPWFLTEADRDV